MLVGNAPRHRRQRRIDELTAEMEEECVCRSTDGRNATCAANDCVAPENFSGECYWKCDD